MRRTEMDQVTDLAGPDRAPAAQLPPAARSSACTDLYRSICRKAGTESRDPTGVVHADLVGEKRAGSLMEAIIEEHPKWDSDALDTELIRRIYTPERTKRLRDAFNWARMSLGRFIARQSDGIFSAAERKILRDRIHRLELELPTESSSYDDEPDLYTKTGIFYERLSDGRLRVRVGGGYLLTATSWFNLLFTFAHELAHAIDPCEMRSTSSEPMVYRRVASCFVQTGMMAPRAAECGDNDQISETFADWIAVQLTGESLDHFATEFDSRQLRHALVNTVRDLCEEDDTLGEVDMVHYLSPQARIEKIFGHHPLIEKLTGCASETAPAYCSFQNAQDFSPEQNSSATYTIYKGKPL